MNIEKLKKTFVYDNGTLRYAISVGNRRAGEATGSKNCRGYLQVGFEGNRVPAHRVVFALHHGYLPQQVDHINGIKTDNRIENLRAATNSENSRNVGLRSSNKSGVKGVYWNKQLKKWVASCRHDGKQHLVGAFRNLIDAADAISAYRAKHHGQFARDAIIRSAIK